MCFQESGFISDSSSGYESSDVSDTENEAVSRLPARHDAHAPARAAVKFRSTGPLCEDLQLLLDMPDMCDVTFLVGAEGTPVHGVRAILATRSK